MRIIVDVCVWIRALISDSFHGYLRTALAPHILLVSKDLLAELKSKARDPRFIGRFASLDEEKLLEYIENNSIKIDVPFTVKVCRDPNDDYLLALALAGEADILLTNDKDLLSMRCFGNTWIMNVAEFSLITNH